MLAHAYNAGTKPKADLSSEPTPPINSPTIKDPPIDITVTEPSYELVSKRIPVGAPSINDTSGVVIPSQTTTGGSKKKGDTQKNTKKEEDRLLEKGVI